LSGLPLKVGGLTKSPVLSGLANPASHGGRRIFKSLSAS
jgi:hypothetical protein